jgi:hypothetical protein
LNVLYLYKFLLLLYPSAHRQEFAEEMLSVFRQVHRDCASLGFKARIRFSLREIAGLLAGAYREHTKVRKGNLGGAMRMFRFPRWTVTLLVVALLVVLAGIVQTQRIGDKFASQTFSPGTVISPRWAMQQLLQAAGSLGTAISPPWGLIQLLQAAALFVCVLAVIVFALRAALGRTCIQRLTAAKTWPAQDARK